MLQLSSRLLGAFVPIATDTLVPALGLNMGRFQNEQLKPVLSETFSFSSVTKPHPLGYL